MKTLTGPGPNPSTVSRVFHTLVAEYEHRMCQSLCDHYAYAEAIGPSFTMAYDGVGCKMP